MSHTVQLTIDASGCNNPKVKQPPRLLSDNGPAYIAEDLEKRLKKHGSVQNLVQGDGSDLISQKIAQMRKTGIPPSIQQALSGMQNGNGQQADTITERLYISSSIKPANSSVILAPFEGVVDKVHVTIGDYVKAGQLLLDIDTSKIDERVREAQSAYIKAQIENDKLKNWADGAEMQRAQRTLNDADREFKNSQREEIEAKGLYDKGIIPRNEYENTVEQTKSRESAFNAAVDELKTTEDQGGEKAFQMATLELENAKSSYESIISDRSKSQVITSIAGIVTLPPDTASGDNKSKNVEPGVQVLKGDALYTIADISRFISEGEVDEIDINKIQYKQKVIIESDALPNRQFEGSIIGISAEAVLSSGMSIVPKYKIRAIFDYDDDTKNLIKIGMSTRMTIITTPTRQARIVPLDVIMNPNEKPQISIVRDGKEQIVDVQLGKTTVGGVEILSGLKEHDKITKFDKYK